MTAARHERRRAREWRASQDRDRATSLTAATIAERAGAS